MYYGNLWQTVLFMYEISPGITLLTSPILRGNPEWSFGVEEWGQPLLTNHIVACLFYGNIKHMPYPP